MFRIHRNALVNLEYLDLLEVLPQSRYQVRFRGLMKHLLSLADTCPPCVKKFTTFKDS